MRALLLVAVLVGAGGCGSDTTMTPEVDMSIPVLDLAHNGVMCGISICTPDCSGCVPLGGGVCVPPCTLADPNSCTAPAMCKPLGGGSADGGGAATLVGNCAGLGYDGYCG